MKERDFSKEIRNAWSLVDKKLEIGRSAICLNSLAIDAAVRDVFLSEESSYADIYRCALSRSSYNFILKDYSYFQFTWNSSDDWRLAFFPNPWLAGNQTALQSLEEWETMESEGILADEDVSALLDDMPYISAVPPIRFEYSRNQYKEIRHPCAHFHIGRHTENRWSSSLLIGPEAFVSLISSQYYATEWSALSRFSSEFSEYCIDEKFMEIVSNLKFCPDFSENEKRLFHFGKG
ncbi:DUF2290 domain-containing protein [Gluconobacter albidus]|uniref:DUF2290 domain-containing protein n=1 Tax=Gluconobacter albidus TaxID=318683 RepID=A0ABQ5X2Y5_9PROT|nr:DUF2290 domain-containing protein [Gluconobacter albidus]GBQ87733.1 hypothetical protein AA3250_1384 [Gluconobacter albidus NBRC 3250]GLQ70178.1 hypothetical protein GCM10007866_26310 [Gluconobacter albidus]